MGSQVERERSYEPGVDARLPDLTALPGVASVGAGRTVDLEAVYFDTPSQSLLRAGVTLRRRTGGEDDGWHLKIPTGDGREEIQLPLDQDREDPPEQLVEAVAGWTRGGGVASVATVATHRTVVDLHDDRHRVLAQVMDDRVEGRPHLRAEPDDNPDDGPDDPEPVAWREWEIELVEGEPPLLAAAHDLLTSDGASLADTQVKLARVVAPPVPPRPDLPEPGARRPARLLLHRRLADQVAELGRRDSEIRRGRAAAGRDGEGDDPTLRGVHKARVACRRLRSALATFRPLLDREVTDPLRDELRWLAHALGEARDLDVAHHRLGELVDAEPADLVVGPVHRRLDRAYPRRRREALGVARDVLASDRYYALRDQLDRLAAAPPWTDRAEHDARDVLPPRVQKEFKRLRRRVRHARSETEPADHDAAMHAVRRAAKRLRYAAETLEPVWGKDAARLTRAAKRLASDLGVRQDAVVARPDLLTLAAQASDAGEDSFTYGLLHAREQQRAEEIDEAFEDLWRVTSRKKFRA